jgi:hypothetical protein
MQKLKYDYEVECMQIVSLCTVVDVTRALNRYSRQGAIQVEHAEIRRFLNDLHVP